MTWPLIILVAASLIATVLAYWRAFRLHTRIREIEPRCPWQRTHFLPSRKDKT